MFGLGNLAGDVKEILNQSQFRVTNMLNVKADAGLAIFNQAMGKLVAVIARNLRLILLLLTAMCAALLYLQYIKYRTMRELKLVLTNMAIGNAARAREGFTNASN